ncbi:MAG: SDR family NAD(P)-dependent oxidoreductase [Bacteroidota bacterium]|nr:SDR family NAD(P)-dependent oxidoreductase [Bacteroidota bacterium]
MTPETVVLITGASSGIGAAAARRFAQEGVRLAIAARRRESLEAIAADAQQLGSTVLVVPTDVTDPEQARRLVQTTLEHFGQIDVLINSAGRGNLASVEGTTPEQLWSIFAVNAFSLWYVAAPALPHMKARRQGHIIVIASVAGKWGYPYCSAYVAAKHAAVGFVAALRTELLETGVEATVLCPAAVDTEWGLVTEGGPLGVLFQEGIRHSKEIARSREIPLAPLPKVLSAEAVAEQLVELVRHPDRADVFTHPGTAELAILVAQDRRAFEGKMMPFYLGVRQAYEDWRAHVGKDSSVL